MVYHCRSSAFFLLIQQLCWAQERKKWGEGSIICSFSLNKPQYHPDEEKGKKKKDRLRSLYGGFVLGNKMVTHA